MTIKSSYAKLPAKDVERAKKFWADHFGLQPVSDVDAHVRYDVAGTTLLVFLSSGSPSGDHDQFGLVVDDAEAEIDRLKKEGVVFPRFEGEGIREDGIMDLGFMKAAWFTDSEGNLISIAQFNQS